MPVDFASMMAVFVPNCDNIEEVMGKGRGR